MTDDTTYNGYTNYATWNVMLWINNDENAYLHWRETARTLLQMRYETTPPVHLTAEQQATRTLADALRTNITSDMYDLNIEPNMFSDILNNALHAVNWQELAEHLLEDCMDDAAIAHHNADAQVRCRISRDTG